MLLLHVISNQNRRGISISPGPLETTRGLPPLDPRCRNVKAPHSGIGIAIVYVLAINYSEIMLKQHVAFSPLVLFA